VALADRRARIAVAVACAALALVAAVGVAVAVEGNPLRKATSGRTHLVEVTLPVIRKYPLAGAGIGAQPLASREEADTASRTSRNASHTTPFTVAAELGVLGLLAYLALLAAGARLVFAAVARNRALGLGLAAVLLTLVLHSLVYAGFFEDPIAWGALALAAAVSAPVSVERHEEPLPGRRHAEDSRDRRTTRVTSSR
jgi:putative inorganic carbon (HCO3(-)) transporter